MNTNDNKYQLTPEEADIVSKAKMAWEQNKSILGKDKIQITNPEKYSFPVGMNNNGQLYQPTNPTDPAPETSE
jgi:hypothetical protein